MPSLTSTLSIAVQSTEVVSTSLDVYLRDLGAELDVLVSAGAQSPVDTDVLFAFAPQVDAQLDMWVSIGGAASQLFELDTTVTRPLIVGDHVLSDALGSASFSIASLDADVVTIALGPSSTGVVSVTDFVNNGDGTGTFTAHFDISYASRQLSIVVTDDVANESAESPLHIVNSLEQARLNDLFSIVPQELVSTPTCNRLIDEVPDSNFTLKRQYTVPYSFEPTVFELRTVTPNAPVEVAVVRRGLPGEPDETQRYVVIPTTETFLIPLRLGRGTNVVTAFDQYNRASTAIVAATTYASVLCSYAREIYNYSQVTVDEQSTAIFSPVATRLAEPLLPIIDLLPDVRSQQVLAAKLATRALVSGAGREIGVRDMLAALTLSTPIFVQQLPDDTYFEPAARPMFNQHEAFGGVEAHVWPANACVGRWLAFINYINNVSVFRVIEISENEVIFYDENGDVQRHVFDLTAEECSLTQLALQALCFDTIDLTIQITSDTALAICAAAYPFDMRANPPYRIVPLGDEFGVELALDPGFDGYLDFNLTQHWDGGVPLDSFGPMPSLASGLPTCIYEEGYAVAPLLLASADTTITAAPDITITATSQTAVGAVLDLLLAADDIEVTAQLDCNVRDTALLVKARLVDLSVSVGGALEVTANLDVLISA
jgi:hypothetical protein